VRGPTGDGVSGEMNQKWPAGVKDIKRMTFGRAAAYDEPGPGKRYWKGSEVRAKTSKRKGKECQNQERATAR